MYYSRDLFVNWRNRLKNDIAIHFLRCQRAWTKADLAVAGPAKWNNTRSLWNWADSSVEADGFEVKPKGPSTWIPLNESAGKLAGQNGSAIPPPIMPPCAYVKDRRSHCRERAISFRPSFEGFYERRAIEIAQSKRKIRSLNLILFVVLWVLDKGIPEDRRVSRLSYSKKEEHISSKFYLTNCESKK